MGKRSASGVGGDADSGGPATAAQPTSSPVSALSGPASVSAVWSYFDKDAAGNSVCKFCARVIKGQHSSNLLSHLRTAGRADAAHQQANNACEEHRKTKRAVKKQKSFSPEDLAADYPQFAAVLAKAATVSTTALTTAVAGAGLALPAYPPPPAPTPALSPAAALVKSQHESYTAAYGGLQATALTLSQDQIAQDLGAWWLLLLCCNVNTRFLMMLPMISTCGGGGQPTAHLRLQARLPVLPAAAARREAARSAERGRNHEERTGAS